MADDLKWVDKQYKEMRPKFVGMKEKYEQMQSSRKQAAKEVIELEEHALSVESQLQQCQKVLRFYITYIHTPIIGELKLRDRQ